MTIKEILTSLKWRLYYKPIGTLRLKNWEPPLIDDIFETLDKLSEEGKSICRFGNGEFDIIWGGSIGFQKPSVSLGKRLYEILHSHEPNVLIALADYYRDKPNLRPHEKVFDYTWRLTNFNKILKLLNSNRCYVNTCISRLYTTYNNVDMDEYISKFKKIWKGKALYVIEGAKCRVGVGNSLFDNAQKVYRIEAPSENAWDKYENILCAAKQNIPKGSIIYIALGATATVLAFDLAKEGYKAMDLGHLDIEYEYFLRKAQGKVNIPGKYVNEVAGGSEVVDDIIDKEYYDSIICRID